MENLSTLEKIYQYGETLSSEEMNQIVSYVNNTIDAVNALIRNNNGINSGHCELRYKNSSSQPQKPTTGSNGLTNGWSNTYSLPNTSQGETAWMTICFVTGENVYGEWSTPVCISWGSVTGQQGPPGQAGTKGAFTSRVFKRANSKPDTPIGGTYDDPVPSGWYDGVPDGVAIIWSSTCTFYGNGTQTAWSEPAQESDTATLDIEFSPSIIQPNAPLGNIPYSNHEIEGWYDPNSPNFDNVGPMIWRAERKVSNGEYDGNWTITRIFGEKGDQGLTGEAGGHYEFRYKNYKPTQEVPVPTKPDTGTEGRSNGWSDTQTTLSEMQLKEGIVTWMTQCFLDEHGYGEWTTPIRLTGANGVDGADGTDYEFIYTRNNTGETPYTPPTTQKSESSLFDIFGQWEEPIHHVVWTDDPVGVDDEHMWEYVSTRTKHDGLWSAWTTPVVWANWGKQGKIGPMSYLAGVWASNVTYTKTAEKNPVVYHNNNYYYLKGEISLINPTITSLGQNPTGTYTDENPNPWAQAENFEMVFTDILFVNDFAKLSSFIINQDWMISKNGTLYYRSGGNTTSYDVDASHSPQINGTTYNVNTAYVQFDPNCPNVPNSTSSHKNPNFVPAIAIDSLSGRCFFWKGKFTGDVVANSLTLGSNVSISQGKVSGLTTDLQSMSDRITGVDNGLTNTNNSLANKLEVTDINVSSDSTSGGLTKNTITVTRGGSTKTFTLIKGGDFVLTDIGKQGDGSYFMVSNKGLLEAHNAIIYGTVYATGGRFSGSVNATEFIAGDSGGLNITTTGDAISFNYGGERRAWFSIKDPSGNDTGGMYLYIKNPDVAGEIITIDFTNLKFKTTSVAGVADQQTTIYQNLTNTNYVASVFVNSEDGLYYSNSNLNSSSIITNWQNYYEKVKEGYSIINYNSQNRLYKTEFYQKISIVNGVKTVISSDYYATAVVFGTKRMLKGSLVSATQQESNVYNEDTNVKISDNSYLTLTSESIYTATTTTNSFGGTITHLMTVSHSGGTTYAKKEDLTMCSS